MTNWLKTPFIDYRYDYRSPYLCDAEAWWAIHYGWAEWFAFGDWDDLVMTDWQDWPPYQGDGNERIRTADESACGRPDFTQRPKVRRDLPPLRHDWLDDWRQQQAMPEPAAYKLRRRFGRNDVGRRIAVALALALMGVAALGAAMVAGALVALEIWRWM